MAPRRTRNYFFEWLKASIRPRVERVRQTLLNTFIVLKVHRSKFLAAAVLFFLFLEITLQIAAYKMLRSTLETPAKRILCVGDYYGPWRPSYPAELRSFLARSKKKQYDVVDLLKEGMTSKEAAYEIDEYLESGQTEAVYLMIGRTDLRSNQIPVSLAYERYRHALDPKTASFQWKLRTPGLVYRLWKNPSYRTILNSIQPKWAATIFQSVSNETSKSQKAPHPTYVSPFIDFPMKSFLNNSSIHELETFPFGRWSLDGKVLDFQTNGILSQQPAKWWIRSNTLRIQNDGATSNFAWQVRNNQLLLFYEFLPVAIVLNKDPIVQGFAKLTAPQDLVLGWQAIAQQSFTVAKMCFQKQIDAFPKDPMGHAGMALTEFQSGKIAEGQKELAIVTGLYRKAPDQRGAEALFYASQTQSSSENSKLAKELIAAYPESSILWFLLAQDAYRDQCYDIADTAIKRAIELVPNTLRNTKSDFLREQAEMLVDRNPETALRSLILAYLQDSSPHSFQSDVIRNAEQYSTLSLDDYFPTEPISEKHKKRLKSIFDEATDKQSLEMINTLEQNLRYIVNHCRLHKVRVVVLLYPKRGRERNLILKNIVNEANVQSIDLRGFNTGSFRKSDSGDSRNLDPSLIDQMVTNSVLEDAKNHFN